jgi:micrococcal nuclease
MKTSARLLIFVCGLSLVGWAQPASTADLLTGKVVSVADGDTLTLLADGTTQVRVRLHGIDAPERGQPFNRRSKDELSSLVFGKVVTVESLGEDRYDRTIGRVRVGGIDVNQHLVEQGMAWHYKRYDQSATLSQAEERARKARRGLWQDPTSLPPWEWRKLDKDERQRRREASPLGAE